MNPLSSQVSPTFALCCYTNTTRHIQVARIVDIENWYFERVIFPRQRLMFEAPQNAHLEIHTSTIASAILTDTIPCEKLKVRSSANTTWNEVTAL